jgi:methylenetetrahydrofolate reductase (NADPH)
MNRFAQALTSGRFLVTAECLPPPGSDGDAIRQISAVLPSELDAVVVADNPDRIRCSAFSAARILSCTGRSGVVMSMATRDRNRIALLSDALGAAALGIEAIFCMSGNHQSTGICPQAASAHDVDTIQFVQAMKKMILYGTAIDGKELEPGLELQVGTTAHPYMRPMEMNLVNLKKKIVAGADFLLTQAVFDLEGFRQWMDVVCTAGLDTRTAIIPSVLLLTSVENAMELQKRRTYGPVEDDIVRRIGKAANAAEEGAFIAAEIAAQLMEIPGVRGIHILSGGCESMIEAVIRQAGIQKQGVEVAI